MKARSSVVIGGSFVVVIGVIGMAGGCSSDDSGKMDAATADTGVDDMGVKDTGRDTGRDTGVMDAGIMCPTPASVASFMTPAYVPATKMPACSQAQIQGYWDNCRVSPATNCNAWRMANAACNTCLVSKRKDPMTPMNDPTFGPLVTGNGIISLNQPGCVELRGDLACAKAMQALNFCTYAACDEQCPVMSNADLQLWNQCITAATSGGCKMYNDAFQMACSNDAGTAYNLCRAPIMGNMAFRDGYFDEAPLFCGQPNDGGGPDAANDGG